MLRTPPSGPALALLRVPLFYKILIANAIIVILGAVLGTAITLHYMRSGGGSTPLLVALLALGGVGVTVLVNALILRLALTPLKLLEETAASVQGGDLDARVPESALADRQLERLTRTFNAMLDNLESYGQRLREVAARALNAEEEERKRISRELHDDTAQTLAALLIRLRLARGADDPASRDALLDQFRGEIGEALERIRRFARGLRPPALDDLGLVPALESHIRALAESSAVEVRMEAEPLDGVLTGPAELALYRIAQEALSNAVRHSGAHRVAVRLRRGAGAVELSVVDDGVGFDVAATRAEGRGLGLFGMEERAFYVGGSVEIDSAPGKKTELRARVPLDPVPGHAAR
ncbi:MAG: sensor histidine kinase [Gemmatimonadetes bacterium]|nr:sensor histidine kinase [Gemmatimonadota bacterium]